MDFLQFAGEMDVSLLFLLAREGNARAVKRLLRLMMRSSRRPHTCLPKHVDRIGQTCLHIAASNGHLEVLKALLSYKEGKEALCISDSTGASPLHSAVAAKPRKVASYLITEEPWILFESDELGRLPIHIAAINGDFQMIRDMACRHPECLGIRSKRTDKTILHYAAEHGHSKLITVISEVYGDRFFGDELDSNGNQPLHLAAMTESYDEVYLAIILGFPAVDPRDCNRKGITADKLRKIYLSSKSNGLCCPEHERGDERISHVCKCLLCWP